MRKVLIAVMVVVGLMGWGLVANANAAAKEVWEPLPEYSEWKDGQEVKAELVRRNNGVNGYTADFLTPDGQWIPTLLDDKGLCLHISPKDEEYCAAKIIPPKGVEPGIFDIDTASGQYKNLGRQMIITFKKIRYKNYEDEKYTQVSAMRPVKVRLDPDPQAPRNTKVIPYQKITGKTESLSWEDSYEGPYDPARSHFEMYLVTDDGTRYFLDGAPGEANVHLLDWLDIKDTVTLYGDLLLFEEEDNFFLVRNVPPVMDCPHLLR